MPSSWIVGVLAFKAVKYTVLLFQYSTCTIAGSYCISASLRAEEPVQTNATLLGQQHATMLKRLNKALP